MTHISIRRSLPPFAVPSQGRDAALGTFLCGFALACGFAAGALYGESTLGFDLGLASGAVLALVASAEACVIALAIGVGLRRRPRGLVQRIGRPGTLRGVMPRK